MIYAVLDDNPYFGACEDLMHISVGIEHIDDIIADVEQALNAVR